MDIIVDIDGTLADLTHRLDYIKTEPKNWGAFFAGVGGDTVIEPIAMVVDDLRLQGNTIILCSGRSDDTLEDTEQWLADNNINYDMLLMRKAGDHRQDSLVKKDMLDYIRSCDLNPELAIDDRTQVVRMWRKEGLLCMQVAEGNF